MKFYKLIKIDAAIHNDLQYWFNTGRTIIVKVENPIEDGDDPHHDRFIELSKLDVLMEVKKNNALVVKARIPKDWLPDPEWHTYPIVIDKRRRKQ